MVPGLQPSGTSRVWIGGDFENGGLPDLWSRDSVFENELVSGGREDLGKLEGLPFYPDML